MGAMVRISAQHSVLLLQVWTGRAGGNYRHSASHLPEELRLQNGPALLALDWAQRGSKQEWHTTEGTRRRRFNALNHVHMCTPPYKVEHWTQAEWEGSLLSYSDMKSFIHTHIANKSRTHDFMQPPTSCTQVAQREILFVRFLQHFIQHYKK